MKLDKEEDFIGKEALINNGRRLEEKSSWIWNGRKRYSKENYEVYKDGEKIGHVTTGYLSPTLKKNVGVALINTEETKLGNEIDIMIRNKPVKAVTVNKRFYKR